MSANTKIQFPDKIFVVARGGRSHEKEHSHKYGEIVLNMLKKNNLITKDLYLHPNGMYTLDGMMTDIEKELPKFHYVWIALIGMDAHGAELQAICDKYGIKYSGEGLFHTSLSDHKYNFKKVLEQHDVKTTYSHFAKNGNIKDEALKAFRLMALPMNIYANRKADTEHVYIAHNFSELENYLSKIFKDEGDGLIEKIYKGQEVKVFLHKENGNIHSHLFTESEDNKQISQEKLIEIRNEALYIYNVLGFKDYVELTFIITKNKNLLSSGDTHPNIISDKYLDLWSKNLLSLEEFIINRVFAV